jgi:hypothetical protein
VALQWATGEAAITRWRGKLMPIMVGQHKCWFYPVLHPAFVLRSTEDSSWDVVFRHDLRRLWYPTIRVIGRLVRRCAVC